MNLKKLSEYDVIIFDCDGVLIDSNLLKCEAFGNAIEEYPNHIIDNFVAYCKKTFGVSRYIKFKEFFINFANEAFDEKRYNTFLSRYEKLCKDIYRDASLTPSVIKVLSLLNNSGCKLYVASGSDEDELREVFNRRDLMKYFKDVYGSPKKKSECVSLILRDDIGVKKAVLIGDAVSDFKTAKEHNLDFIYMSEYTVQSSEQDEFCRKNANFVINTLNDLL